MLYTLPGGIEVYEPSVAYKQANEIQVSHPRTSTTKRVPLSQTFNIYPDDTKNARVRFEVQKILAAQGYNDHFRQIWAVIQNQYQNRSVSGIEVTTKVTRSTGRKRDSADLVRIQGSQEGYLKVWEIPPTAPITGQRQRVLYQVDPEGFEAPAPPKIDSPL